MAYSIVAACVMILRYDIDDFEGDELILNGTEDTEISIFSRLFNSSKVTEPTKFSSNLVTFLVTLFAIFSIWMSMVISQFGHKILLDNGELNRQALAELIFSDRKNREWLEMTLHPLIHTAFIEKLDCIRKSTTGRQQKLVLYVAPLYFEALHPSTLFSAIIVVNAPRDLCISRIMQRDSLSLEQACLRYDTQMPLEEKCAMATWVINNDSDTRSLQKEVEKVFSAIMKV